MTDKTLNPGWRLLARVKVDKSRRVQCQCRGCGQTVYADIHIIGWSDGEIACWGSRCFAREMGEEAKTAQAVYSGVSGRKLTAEERDLLDSNREGLIARFKKEEEEKAAAWKRHTEVLIRQASEHIVKPVKPRIITRDPNDRQLTRQQPTSPGGPPVKFDERSHKFTITSEQIAEWLREVETSGN